ncbi:nucleotidyltransferase family protein [Paenibacillus chitinolyticus]|uniref:nucleotidyltransferase family protein n=1 Tax=Paenibacillus chitinolyticus TaxID=79263 RepID=UPI0036D7AC5F
MQATQITRESDFLVKLVMGHEEEARECLKADLDWAELERLMIEQKVLPFVIKRFRPWFPEHVASHLDEWMRHYTETIIPVQEEVARVSQPMQSEGINVSFLKGSTLSLLIYGDSEMRLSYDIDLLMNEKDANKIHSVLAQRGYRHLCGDPDPFDPSTGVRSLNAPVLKDFGHHEYFEYEYIHESNHIVVLELQRFIHNSVKDASLIQKFLSHSQEINLNGTPIPVPDNEHTALILLEGLYTDAEWFYRGPKLYRFLDVIELINHCEIDWEVVLRHAEIYGMGPIIRHSSNLVNELCRRDVIPDWVLAKLESDQRIPFHDLDWGTDVAGRIFESDDVRTGKLLGRLKQFCYSERNVNWLTPHRVERESEDNGYSILRDRKYGFDHRFLVCTQDGNLIIDFVLAPDMYRRYRDFEIALRFLDPDPNSSSFFSEEVHFILREKRYSLLNQQTGEIVITEQGHMQASIPAPSIKCKQGKAAFLFVIMEKVDPKIHHHISPNWYTDKECWLNAPFIDCTDGDDYEHHPG